MPSNFAMHLSGCPAATSSRTSSSRRDRFSPSSAVGSCCTLLATPASSSPRPWLVELKSATMRYSRSKLVHHLTPWQSLFDHCKVVSLLSHLAPKVTAGLTALIPTLTLRARLATQGGQVGADSGSGLSPVVPQDPPGEPSRAGRSTWDTSSVGSRRPPGRSTTTSQSTQVAADTTA